MRKQRFTSNGRQLGMSLSGVFFRPQLEYRLMLTNEVLDVIVFNGVVFLGH